MVSNIYTHTYKSLQSSLLCKSFILLSRASSMALNSYSSVGAVCEKDCKEIHAKWDSLSLLGQALALRPLRERRQIKETYRSLYGEDLVDRLYKTHLTNPKNEMYKMLYHWMLEPHERDALTVNEAIDGGVEIDYSALVEIYARRKSSHLFLTKQYYLSRFKKHLEQEIVSEQAQPYQRILVALATSHRSHDTMTNRHIAQCDAKRLHEAGKRTASMIDESTILEIFSKRSIPQLRLAFSSYKHIYGHEYIKILKDNGGEFEECVRLVVKCMHQPSKYYTKMLHANMKGPNPNTKNKTKSAVISSLLMGIAEGGLMEDVKSSYQNKHRMSLEEAISESIPAGDHRDFLIALTNDSAGSSRVAPPM